MSPEDFEGLAAVDDDSQPDTDEPTLETYEELMDRLDRGMAKGGDFFDGDDCALLHEALKHYTSRWPPC